MMPFNLREAMMLLETKIETYFLLGNHLEDDEKIARAEYLLRETLKLIGGEQ